MSNAEEFDDGAGTHGGQRAGAGSKPGHRRSRLIDRMPIRARALELPEPYRVFVKGDTCHATGLDVSDAGGPCKPWWKPPSQEQADVFRQIQDQTVTSWGAHEKGHPINAFEQVIECEFCGAWRAPFTTAAKCCQHGALVLNQKYKLGQLLLDLARRGVSKVSRSLNNAYRFAVMRLPKDSHWNCDSFQHLKVTGQPFAMMNNLNDATSTRSFLDEPLERVARATDVTNKHLRPHPADVRVVDTVLSANPLAMTLVNWAGTEQATARLALKWEGTTQSVRAFTCTPSTSVVTPRSIYFTRQADDESVKIYANDPLYPVLMWPLVFPQGQPLANEAGVPLGISNSEEYSSLFSVNQVTLALLMQPERNLDGSIAMFNTRSPWDHAQCFTRPLSKLELFGRLGDEMLLDRFLTSEDARLRTIATPFMQRRLTGQFAAETEADADDQSRGTYLPASVTGSPRDMRDRVGNAMCARRVIGPPLLFITATTDVAEWEEILGKLLRAEMTDGEAPRERHQDAFDRAGLTAEAFHGKLEALLARLRTGSIFRNVGRPVLVDGKYECRFKMKGGGYLIWSIEYQGRGLVHAHIIWRPAKMPEGFEQGFQPGQRLDWVDKWVCARIPDESVLRDFGMLGTVGAFRDLDGVRMSADERSPDFDTPMLDAYKYLWADGVTANTEVLHPDIVKDHGYGLANDSFTYDHACGKKALLDRLIELTVEQKADGDDHWSLHPHRKGSHKAKMIHSHTKGIDVPDDWCKKRGKTGGCKGHFPKAPAEYTHVSEEGWIVYRRRACDRMVVAYNPWISLYFTSHINVSAWQHTQTLTLPTHLAVEAHLFATDCH